MATVHVNETEGKQKLYTKNSQGATWLEPGESFECDEGDEIARVLDIVPEPEPEAD